MRRAFTFAFTLIELLVVIVIILILMGLTMSLAGPIRQQLMARKTSASMQSIVGMISQRSAEFGGTVTVAEHPLAGSRAPRQAFQRGVSQPSPGSAVQTSGEALIGVALGQVTDAGVVGSRVLLPDDVFSDLLCPMLVGVPRRSLGILGAPRTEITAYRRLTPIESGGMVASDARSTFVVAPVAGTAEHERAVALTLGDEGVKALRTDGVLWAPAADTPAGVDDRVWIGDFPKTASRPGSRVDITGVSTPYRILGSAIYDAWGREILFESLPGGQIRLLSAGRDGFFRFHPGPDGVIDSSATASVPAGDDRDGSLDNIASMPEARL